MTAMTRTLTPPGRRAAQHGLSLVELMVALTIGLFLLAGVVTVFGKTRDLYRVNETTARLQETARYAMSTLETDLRMANYWGFDSRPDLIENAPGLDPSDPSLPDPTYTLPADLNYPGQISACGAMWAVKLVSYIEATNGTYGLSCGAWGTASPVADQLTVRRASVERILPANLGSTGGQIKVQTSRSRGVLFGGTTLPSGYTPATSETHAVVAHGYYVDQDSNLRRGLPSLRRKTLAFAGGPQIVDEEVVSGVEDLQVQFGIDQDGDQNADYFVDPLVPVSAADAVVAARVWLLVRAEQAEVGFTDDRVYEYADRTTAAGTAYAPADGFRRLLVSKTISLRNTRR